ncbi:hypothetical protein PQ459_08345 [Chryseobacterium sp. KACC 21268]|nr:hypothetical protein PQ459_08345 [Chryseobacterium sp. KACC 21268]
MKKLLTLFLLLILIGCSKSKFDIEERNEDISSIIKTVIETDSLNVSKNNPENNKIVQFLKKVKVVLPNPDKNIISPPNRDARELDEIYNSKSERVFSKNDSLYLLSQNTNPDSLEISNKLKVKYNYSQLSKILKDRDNGNYYQYYEFEIPLFSKDNKTAYIELNYHSKGYFGKGIAYILKKENDKWKVVDRTLTWIN